MNSSHDISFDGWTLCRSTGELVRDGVCQRLPIQSCRVLEELLARPGELVTRETLIARVWPRGVVEYDAALNTIVHRVRVALGDAAGHPRYIETIPRRGYRFIGQLTPAGAPAAEVAPGSAETVPAAPIARLVGPGPATSMVRRATGIGAAVAATFVLMMAATGAYTRLEGRVDPGTGAAAPGQPAAVRESVARARFLMQRREPGDMASARRGFLEAIAEDAGAADAWAGLASTWWLDVAEARASDAIDLSRVVVAARRALELDSRNVEAHIRMYQALLRTGDPEAADEHLRLARAHGRGHPLVLAADIDAALASGRLETAIGMARRAVDAEPLAVAARQNLYVLLVMADRLDEAAVENEHILELNPGSEVCRENRVELLVLRGRHEDALEAARTLGAGPARSFYNAVAYHALGRRDESDAELRAVMEAAEGDYRVRVAEIMAYRGDRAAALEALRAATHQSPSCSSNWVRYSPYLRSLRDEPLWRAWVRSRPGSDVG
jgi:DNA-binding winged helix-turn-helix (wHTH) protein/tetratricopeptide (TPR) repeat protein